ncbi:MAG TPA: pirin family protein [Candidatus Thermoplasmatota archaeon]|nr:pirin family protein [Candidatus Thermoplasmatota archaeon]
MTTTPRPAAARGATRLDWLDSRHSFSFGGYQDAAWTGFRALRVLNDDRVAPGGGFGAHPHRDMEILSYVVEGALRHEDSMGTGSTVSAGDVQRMSAGTGVTHAEWNASKTEPARFLQVWILPETRDLAPSYEQRAFPLDERAGRWALLAARRPREGALRIHQDVEMWGVFLPPHRKASGVVAPARHAWVQVVRGSCDVLGVKLVEGDGLAISETFEIPIVAGSHGAEVVLFDLA